MTGGTHELSRWILNFGKWGGNLAIWIWNFGFFFFSFTADGVGGPGAGAGAGSAGAESTESTQSTVAAALERASSAFLADLAYSPYAATLISGAENTESVQPMVDEKALRALEKALEKALRACDDLGAPGADTLLPEAGGENAENIQSTVAVVEAETVAQAADLEKSLAQAVDPEKLIQQCKRSELLLRYWQLKEEFEYENNLRWAVHFIFTNAVDQMEVCNARVADFMDLLRVTDPDLRRVFRAAICSFALHDGVRVKLGARLQRQLNALLTDLRVVHDSGLALAEAATLCGRDILLRSFEGMNEPGALGSDRVPRPAQVFVEVDDYDRVMQLRKEMEGLGNDFVSDPGFEGWLKAHCAEAKQRNEARRAMMLEGEHVVLRRSERLKSKREQAMRAKAAETKATQSVVALARLCREFRNAQSNAGLRKLAKESPFVAWVLGGHLVLPPREVVERVNDVTWAGWNCDYEAEDTPAKVFVSMLEEEEEED